MIHSLQMPTRDDFHLYLEIGHYLLVPPLIYLFRQAVKIIDSKIDARVDKIAAQRDAVVMDHAEQILNEHQKHDDMRFAELERQTESARAQVEQRQTIVMARLDGLSNRIDALLLKHI